jgi:hypothetical protein
MKAYEDRCRDSGETVSHGKMKELLAAFAAAEADKLVETKGLDFLDREKLKRLAAHQAHALAKEKYGEGQVGPGSGQGFGDNSGQGFGGNSGQRYDGNYGQGFGGNAGQGYDDNSGQGFRGNSAQGYDDNYGQGFGGNPGQGYNDNY